MHVISVPLSETMILGLPRLAMMISNSRTSRSPNSDVSMTMARHLRVKSSTTAKTRKRRQYQRPPRSQGTLSATALADSQPLFAIEPPELLQVHDDALSIQHDVDTAITETAAL